MSPRGLTRANNDSDNCYCSLRQDDDSSDLIWPSSKRVFVTATVNLSMAMDGENRITLNVGGIR